MVHIGIGRTWSEEAVQEFRELALASGANVVGEIVGSRMKPDPKFFVGTGKAEAILTALENNQTAIRRGNIDLHPAFVSLVRGLVAETRDAERAPIDEPVTTDTHRLIRLPGSLHGGSGLRVTRIERDELDAFDPLDDAVPETFREAEIAVDVTDLSGLPPVDDPTTGQVELGGGTFTVTDGNDLYPEFLGIFLMTRGRAEKDRE